MLSMKLYSIVLGSRGSNCGMPRSISSSLGVSRAFTRNGTSTLCSPSSRQYLPVISRKSGLCGL